MFDQMHSTIHAIQQANKHKVNTWGNIKTEAPLCCDAIVSVLMSFAQKSDEIMDLVDAYWSIKEERLFCRFQENFYAEILKADSWEFVTKPDKLASIINGKLMLINSLPTDSLPPYTPDIVLSKIWELLCFIFIENMSIKTTYSMQWLLNGFLSKYGICNLHFYLLQMLIITRYYYNDDKSTILHEMVSSILKLDWPHDPFWAQKKHIVMMQVYKWLMNHQNKAKLTHKEELSEALIRYNNDIHDSSLLKCEGQRWFKLLNNLKTNQTILYIAGCLGIFINQRHYQTMSKKVKNMNFVILNSIRGKRCAGCDQVLPKLRYVRGKLKNNERVYVCNKKCYRVFVKK